MKSCERGGVTRIFALNKCDQGLPAEPVWPTKLIVHTMGVMPKHLHLVIFPQLDIVTPTETIKSVAERSLRSVRAFFCCTCAISHQFGTAVLQSSGCQNQCASPAFFGISNEHTTPSCFALRLGKRRIRGQFVCSDREFRL